MRKKIFISHAVPNDDYLAVWLASKLNLLGYDVWVDKEDLRSGSAFWNNIDLLIRKESIRFLAIISEAYILKSQDRNTGVFTELNAAKTVSREIENYVIPIRADNSSFDDFPLVTLGLDAVDFSINWGAGLKKLIKELELYSIPQTEPEENTLALWYKYQSIQGSPKKQFETYGSNWFECSLPKKISVYKFQGDLAKIGKHIPFPFVRNGDYCIGFFNDDGLEVGTLYKEDILVEDFLFDNSYPLDSGDMIIDTEPKFVNLMNRAIYNYFYFNEDFKAYPVANKKLVVYPIQTHSKSGYVSFTRNGKKGRRTLKGTKPVNWSFGLSFIFQLHPFPHYIANHHLLSSDSNGFFKDDDQLKYRRSIPSEWYNRHWFERILAFMNLASGLKDYSVFSFQCGRETIEIQLETVSFQSDYSYEET